MKNYTLGDLEQWLSEKPGRSSSMSYTKQTGWQVRLTDRIGGRRVEFYGTGQTLNRAVHWAFDQVNNKGNTTIFGMVRIGAL